MLSASRHAVSNMKSERLRPKACAARSISDFWIRLTRRLMFSPRLLLDFVIGSGMMSSYYCIHVEYTPLCAHCKYTIGILPSPFRLTLRLSTEFLNQRHMSKTSINVHNQRKQLAAKGG